VPTRFLETETSLTGFGHHMIAASAHADVVSEIGTVGAVTHPGRSADLALS
jgi:hypothetical protein